jgi:hypothetical protein
MDCWIVPGAAPQRSRKADPVAAHDVVQCPCARKFPTCTLPAATAHGPEKDDPARYNWYLVESHVCDAVKHECGSGTDS